ncbi:hypothetical protein Dimus_010293 [Dionaea muscipula]
MEARKRPNREACWLAWSAVDQAKRVDAVEQTVMPTVEAEQADVMWVPTRPADQAADHAVDHAADHTADHAAAEQALLKDEDAEHGRWPKSPRELLFINTKKWSSTTALSNDVAIQGDPSPTSAGSFTAAATMEESRFELLIQA